MLPRRWGRCQGRPAKSCSHLESLPKKAPAIERPPGSAPFGHVADSAAASPPLAPPPQEDARNDQNDSHCGGREVYNRWQVPPLPRKERHGRDGHEEAVGPERDQEPIPFLHGSHPTSCSRSVGTMPGSLLPHHPQYARGASMMHSTLRRVRRRHQYSSLCRADLARIRAPSTWIKKFSTIGVATAFFSCTRPPPVGRGIARFAPSPASGPPNTAARPAAGIPCFAPTPLEGEVSA
jgi:hypothetical protein